MRKRSVLIPFLMVMLQVTTVCAAELPLKKATSTNKNAANTTGVANVGDAAQAEKDIAKATAPRTVSGVGYTPTAEANAYPRGTVTPDPLPANVAVSGGECPQLYRCVVPHGSMLLATCLPKTGAPGESSSCAPIQTRCSADENIRRQGGTLDQAEGDFFDHNCKANL